MATVDLRALMRRAHSKTRRLMRAGLSYAATLGAVLRDLWALLRRPLPPLTGRRHDVRKATDLRDRWMPYYVQKIEDAVLEYQDEDMVFEQGIALTCELFRTDAQFWIDVGSHGFFGVWRLADIIRGRPAQ